MIRAGNSIAFTNMKNIPLALRFFILIGVLLSQTSLRAGSATWSASPATNDWLTATNWMPNTVPNGPDDIATFAVTDRSVVHLLASGQLSGVVFAAGAPGYFISVSGFANSLTIGDAGITNNSSLPQSFVPDYELTHIDFVGSAKAGAQTYFDNKGAVTDFGPLESYTQFFDTSSADHATITNEGTKGEATAGYTQFFNSSTAAEATIIKQPALNIGDIGGSTYFYDQSNAGNANILNKGGGGAYLIISSTEFHDNSSAASSTITADGAFRDRDQGGGTCSLMIRRLTILP
ncbi:MAG: hypothetical protein ACREIF_14175 [Chthoniobacterales bacterium]